MSLGTKLDFELILSAQEVFECLPNHGTEPLDFFDFAEQYADYICAVEKGSQDCLSVFKMADFSRPICKHVIANSIWPNAIQESSKTFQPRIWEAEALGIAQRNALRRNIPMPWRFSGIASKEEYMDYVRTVTANGQVQE